jgi:hypothetical protein
MWLQAELQHIVAALVRLEQRCTRRRTPAHANAQLANRRRELGLHTGADLSHELRG